MLSRQSVASVGLLMIIDNYTRSNIIILASSFCSKGALFKELSLIKNSRKWVTMYVSVRGYPGSLFRVSV